MLLLHEVHVYWQVSNVADVLCETGESISHMFIKILFCERLSTAFICNGTILDESFTLEQADESEPLEASKGPYTVPVQKH